MISCSHEIPGIKPAQERLIEINGESIKAYEYNPEDVRKVLIDMVRKYAVANKVEYRMAWSRLYSLLGLHNRKRIISSARAKKIKVLDYVEQQELLLDAYNIASQIFSKGYNNEGRI